MYVCVYVCMCVYVCVYVCMYLCMCVCTYVYISVCKHYIHVIHQIAKISCTLPCDSPLFVTIDGTKIEGWMLYATWLGTGQGEETHQ